MMDKLIENVGAEVPSHIQLIKAADPKEVVDNCEALCSATKITRETYNIVRKDWIRPGQTIFPMDLLGSKHTAGRRQVYRGQHRRA